MHDDTTHLETPGPAARASARASIGRRWRLTIALLPMLALAAPAFAFTPDDLVGSWIGEARHDGTTSPIGFAFEAGAPGAAALPSGRVP